MSDKYKSLERAIREVMSEDSVNEEKQSLPMHSKGLLLKHQKAIKKLAAALRLYYSTRLDVIDDEPNLYVPEYDTMINYDSGADTFNPLKDEGTIANSVRNLGSWERITTKAIDDLVKGKYDVMESTELSEATKELAVKCFSFHLGDIQSEAEKIAKEKGLTVSNFSYNKNRETVEFTAEGDSFKIRQMHDTLLNVARYLIRMER
jgi:hypothetical protein